MTSTTTNSIGVRDGHLRLGDHLTLSFQRTLRIPDDGSNYPLPPGLGAFPIYRVDDYADRVPQSWKDKPGVFIPMYQREALWLSFQSAWPPCALKVGIGGVCAITGKRFATDKLRRKKQDYLVVPDQPWLDGINAGDGFIRQFVAMPLGRGYTVEAQLTGEETRGGIQLAVFPAKPGLFPARRPFVERALACAAPPAAAAGAGASMGLGAGGRMRQTIHPDDHGPDTWDLDNALTVDVHIVNSTHFRSITGHEPPPTPVDARTYTQHGYPWFELYDETPRDVRASTKLAQVRSIKDKDAEHGFTGLDDDAPVDIPAHKIVPVKPAALP